MLWQTLSRRSRCGGTLSAAPAAAMPMALTRTRRACPAASACPARSSEHVHVRVSCRGGECPRAHQFCPVALPAGGSECQWPLAITALACGGRLCGLHGLAASFVLPSCGQASRSVPFALRAKVWLTKGLQQLPFRQCHHCCTFGGPTLPLPCAPQCCSLVHVHPFGGSRCRISLTAHASPNYQLAGLKAGCVGHHSPCNSLNSAPCCLVSAPQPENAPRAWLVARLPTTQPWHVGCDVCRCKHTVASLKGVGD